MKTTIYLIRHSLKFDNKHIIKYNTIQDNTIRSEKIVLSVEGENRAFKLSKMKELESLDLVYCSNCVRTLDTAKYVIESQNLSVTIDERLDEKVVGKSNEDIYPDWFRLQYYDENFKTIGGESQKEVRERFISCFDEILENNKGKRIAIFSHGYAITFFLMRYAKLEDITTDRIYKFSYNNEVFFYKKLSAPEIFKLVFNDNELESITNIPLE